MSSKKSFLGWPVFIRIKLNPSKPKLYSEKWLIENRWWWRHVNDAIEKFIEADLQNSYKTAKDKEELKKYLKNTWRDYQMSAFLYEIAERINGKYEFGKPWVNLSKDKLLKLVDRWPNPHSPPIPLTYKQLSAREPYTWDGDKDPGWTVPYLIRINLNVNNSLIIDKFKELIEGKRKQQNFKNPPQKTVHQPGLLDYNILKKYDIHPRQPKGISRKDKSFKPIELLDLEKFMGTVLNDSERSQKFKAIKEYKSSI